MAPLPLLGRLYLQEYFALLGSFILVGLETLIRIVTLALPDPIVRTLYRVSRRVFNWLSSSQGKKLRAKKRGVSSPIAKASDFLELCELFGYYAEEHVIHTGDGYLLGVHRLGWRKEEREREQKVNSGPGSLQKRVVYLHHGLMMNSEVWVCLTEEERCLPFVLVEKGYDVWLGNNRGNKYSKKSVNHSPTSSAFWNFSIDQFAFHDIPDSINYILDTTKQKSLSYIGFSQGTAQAFATLSIHPQLNEKVDLFIALAPAMSPPGLTRGIVTSFIKTSPEVLFLLFGRKAILSSTTMWESVLYPALFCWFIDKSLSFLFGWHSENITPHQKLAAYPHLFSYSSTKSVVHWFQIIRTGTFQMYDDEVQAPISVGNGSKYYKVAKFPTRNIKTPIVLIYGGADSLVDINVMMRELPKHIQAIEVSHYEHLDFLWASDVHQKVFPHVLSSLNKYAPGSKVGQEAKVVTSRKDSNHLQTPQRLALTNGESATEEDDDGTSCDSDAVEHRRRFRAGNSPHPSFIRHDITNSLLEDEDHLSDGVKRLSSSPRRHQSNSTPLSKIDAQNSRPNSGTSTGINMANKQEQQVAESPKLTKAGLYKRSSFDNSSRSSAGGGSHVDKPTSKSVAFGNIGIMPKAMPADSVVDKANVGPEKSIGGSEMDKTKKKSKNK